jgi:hypothetical protein
VNDHSPTLPGPVTPPDWQIPVTRKQSQGIGNTLFYRHSAHIPDGKFEPFLSPHSLREGRNFVTIMTRNVDASRRNGSHLFEVNIRVWSAEIKITDSCGGLEVE